MILVAGIGNIFLGDDGFGCAVIAALGAIPNTTVRDFGIRGYDLAFALTTELDAAILVDAVQRGDAPGTLYVIEPTVDDAPAALDAHSLDPVAVLRLAKQFGKLPSKLWLVGCEPAQLDGDLSETVTSRIPDAARLVRELVERCTS